MITTLTSKRPPLLTSSRRSQVCVSYPLTGKTLSTIIADLADLFRGGMRGIVILEVLRQFQAELGEIQVQEFFDLIIGTE